MKHDYLTESIAHVLDNIQLGKNILVYVCILYLLF